MSENNEFPSLVYKGEGQHSRNGGTYAFSEVVSQDDLDQKLNDGWFMTLPEAIDAHDNGDEAMPTRKELSEKANELGIKFGGRTSNDKLAALIQEALAKE